FCPKGEFLSPTGEDLALCGMVDQPNSEWEIVIWNPVTNMKRAGLKPPQFIGKMLFDIAFTGDGRLVAGADMNGSIHVADLLSRDKPVLTIESAHQGMINTMAWNEDGTRLWTFGVDGALNSWELSLDSPSTKLKSNLLT